MKKFLPEWPIFFPGLRLLSLGRRGACAIGVDGFLYLEYLRQPPLARPFSHGSFAPVGDDDDWTFKPQCAENSAVFFGSSGASATRNGMTDIFRKIGRPIEGGPNTLAACESAEVRDPLPGLRLGRGSGLCWKLEHCCFLT